MAKNKTLTETEVGMRKYSTGSTWPSTKRVSASEASIVIIDTGSQQKISLHSHLANYFQHYISTNLPQSPSSFLFFWPSFFRPFDSLPCFEGFSPGTPVFLPP
jgi:hypothetical protein